MVRDGEEQNASTLNDIQDILTESESSDVESDAESEDNAETYDGSQSTTLSSAPPPMFSIESPASEDLEFWSEQLNLAVDHLSLEHPITCQTRTQHLIV